MHTEFKQKTPSGKQLHAETGEEKCRRVALPSTDAYALL